MEEQPSGAMTYRVSLASGAQHLPRIFPEAATLGRGDYQVVVANLSELNRKLGELISTGAVVAAVVPTRSALEQQFREAVGETT